MRVIHAEAKSWDRRPFEREALRIVDLHRDRLSPTERLRLAPIELYKRARLRLSR